MLCPEYGPNGWMGGWGLCSVCGSKKCEFVKKSKSQHDNHKSGGDIEKLLLGRKFLQQLGYQVNFIYQDILSLVQKQT